MRGQLLAAAVLLATTSLAGAADPASPTPPAGFDWTGWYVGGHLGYGWGDSKFYDDGYNGIEEFSLTPFSFDVASGGVIGGLQAGHNWQSGAFVYGIEGELGYLDLNGKDYPPPFEGEPYDTWGGIDGGWYGGISGKLGYAVDGTLIYAKAGAVYSGGKVGYVDDCNSVIYDPITGCGPGTLDSTDNIGWGYQVGAGVEHAITEKWALKLEYAYFDFGNVKLQGVAVGSALDGRTITTEADLSAHIVKIGINYHF